MIDHEIELGGANALTETILGNAPLAQPTAKSPGQIDKHGVFYPLQDNQFALSFHLDPPTTRSADTWPTRTGHSQGTITYKTLIVKKPSPREPL